MRQNGAALIVTLVILFVLTMLGITSMNMSNLELKMATNTQEKSSALQQSEFALTIADDAIDELANQLNTGGVFPAGAGYYDLSTPPAIPPDVETPSFWKNSSNYIANGANGGYVIEFMGRDTVVDPENRFDPAAVAKPVFVFRVSAHGTGAVSASTLVQMMYLRIDSTGA